MSLLRRCVDAARNEGLSYVLKESVPHLHRHHVRQYLPRRCEDLNGVTVRSARWLDEVVPWEIGRPDPENYESAIVSRLKEHVEPGDIVVIVGGGWGVTSVVAAIETGADGHVYTYEASPRYANYVRETLSLNDVSDRCEVTNAVVSHTVSTHGNEEATTVVAPDELPDCDVLELDCEGAESAILRKMEIQPRVLIVETHGYLDSPTEDVVDMIERRSYEVVTREVADRGLIDMCESQDVRVVTAVCEG